MLDLASLVLSRMRFSNLKCMIAALLAAFASCCNFEGSDSTKHSMFADNMWPRSLVAPVLQPTSSLRAI